jgi:hypothetical protein
MTGTIYNLKTIAAHTGLSQNYLKKGDSSLKQVIATFPELSPDGVGLSDIGLLVFDEYIRCCSNKNGKPLMKFEEWKQLMIEEYGVKPMDNNEEVQLTVIEDNSQLNYEPIQPINIGNVMGGFKDKINAMGDELATETASVLDSNIAKIEAVLVSRAERLNAALNSFNK